jgi:hyperosmotically inducible periplasmic protein
MMKVGNGRIFLGAWLLSATVAFMVGCDNRGPTTAGSGPAATMGTTIDDSVITARVKSELLADPVVKGLDAKVETYKGTVQLSGFVDSQAQMDRAIEIARSVQGVNGVENKMNIKK